MIQLIQTAPTPDIVPATGVGCTNPRTDAEPQS